MNEIQNKYEVVMVFSLADGEDKAKAVAEKFNTLIEENGTIDSTDVWGKRRLAYLINDEPEGFYVYTQFTSGPDFPAELNRIFQITDGTLRNLVVRKELV